MKITDIVISHRQSNIQNTHSGCGQKIRSLAQPFRLYQFRISLSRPRSLEPGLKEKFKAVLRGSMEFVASSARQHRREKAQQFVERIKIKKNDHILNKAV